MELVEAPPESKRRFVARCSVCKENRRLCQCVPVILKTVSIGLQTNNEEKQALLRTMEAFNHACNNITKFGIDDQFQLQKECYRSLRDSGLSSQLSMNAIKRVATAWKLSKTRPWFNPHSSVCLDRDGVRIIGDQVSLSTIEGRRKIPLRLSVYHRARLSRGRVRRGCNLCYRKDTKAFYITAVVEEEATRPAAPSEVLGVDLGITNLAVDSNGKTYSDSRVDKVRERYEDLRGRLRSVGTRSARRHLVRLSGKERRFKRDVNHCASKGIVQSALGTSSTIAMEDLKGIRERTTVRRSQRTRHSKWAFRELRKFVEYKAAKEGVPLVLVNPKNTSRRCPQCKFVSKKNRKTRDEFNCKNCGFAAPADYVGAMNIKEAAFSLPIAALTAAAIPGPSRPGS